MLAKLDRGYEDYLDGRISEDFWGRKAVEWEEQRRVIDTGIARMTPSDAGTALTAEKILESANKASSTPSRVL